MNTKINLNLKALLVVLIFNNAMGSPVPRDNSKLKHDLVAEDYVAPDQMTKVHSAQDQEMEASVPEPEAEVGVTETYIVNNLVASSGPESVKKEPKLKVDSVEKKANEIESEVVKEDVASKPISDQGAGVGDPENVQPEIVAEPEPNKDESVAEPEPGKESVAEPEPGKESVAESEAGKESVAEPEPEKEYVPEPEPEKESVSQPEVEKTPVSIQKKEPMIERSDLNEDALKIPVPVIMFY